MKTPFAVKLLGFVCVLASLASAAPPKLKSSDVALVSRLAADEALGRTLTVSISDIGNDTLGQRIAEKVRSEAAKAGFARVCIVQVDRDGVSSRQGIAGGSSSGVVTMPDGSSFAMPSAGPGFKLHRVSGDLVVREVIRKPAGV